MAQTRHDVHIIGDVLDLHAVPTPRASTSVRVVSYIDKSSKSVKRLSGVRYISRIVVQELQLIRSKYHINKGTADTIAAPHQLHTAELSKSFRANGGILLKMKRSLSTVLQRCEVAS